jgi:N12 class adenine-specific DNA methylase
MAWDWLKDNNDEPNEFKPIDARGLLDGKEYHDYWTTKLHNGLANVPKSLLGAVESIPAMAARTRPVVMQELENDLDGTGLMDSDADKEALSDVENQIKGTTAPIWEGARLGVKAAKDALPDANWESNVDESQLSYPKKIGGMILENAPLMAAQLGASIINPALGVALMAGSIAGDAYNDLTEKGVDPLTAGQAGWLDAAAQAPLEGVGEMGWLKAFRELGTEGAAKLMGKAFVKEGLTEAVQEFPDETIPYIAEHGSLDGFDWGQLASNAVDAGVVGGIYGGGFAGIGRAINGKAQAPQQETGQDSAGVDNGNGDTPSPSPAIHAMNRLVNELGIDPKAASGIVGGLMLESGGNTTDISPTAKNPKSGSYGIGQWLGPRQDELMAFAEETGGDPNDLDTQISFLIHELKGSESGALQEIIKAQSPDEAGRLADKFYERSEGTDEIRNQKAANAQKIYDIFMNGGADPNVVYSGGKRGGSSVPNPKSAEDFLKDLEETLPADTDEDVEKLNAVRKAIQDKNKKAQEELAAQYGWSANSPETAQGASEPAVQGNTQSAANNAATGQMTQSVTYPMAIPQGRGNSISSTKSIKSDGGMYQPSGRVEGDNKSVYTPKKPKGMQYTPQGNVQAGSNEGGMTAVQPNVAPVIPAPSSIKEPASNASTSLPSTEPQIYTPRKVNGIADHQRRDRQTRGNMASAATQDRINKALKNSRLRQVVKQAFVDGDKDALKRLGAMQINQDILQAVKDDVLNEYHKVEPVVLPKVVPAQEPYTPRYGSRDEAMRLPYERNNENARGDIAIGGGDGVISSQRASTPREAVRLDNKARKNRETNENRAYDIGEAPSPKEQKKAAIARARQEKRDAKNTNFSKYEPAPYATRYANRDKVMQGFHNINENMSGNEARKDRVTGITSSGNNGDASNQNRAGSRDMSAYKNPNRLSVSMPSRDRQGIGEDMRNRQQNRNAYEPDTKSRLEKPTIFAKENTNENHKENQQVHRSEENKNDNAKPEQSKPSESKDGKTPEGKNPVKKAPPKETPSSGKKEEPHNEKGSEQQPTLANGYTTESGRLLSESDARDFIVKPDRSKEFGHFGKEIEDATRGKVLAKGIRLQVGFSRVANGKETGFGIIHIKKRESQLKKLGYNNAEEYILDIINNFSIIYDLGGGRIKLASVGSKFNVMPLDLELQGDGNGYYTVVTAIPKNTKRMQKEAGKKIFDRSASPSSTTGNGAVQDGGNRKNAGSIPQSATEKSNLPASTNNIDETLKNVNNKHDLDLTTGKSIEASKGEEPSTPKETVFGSVEDADKDLEKAFGLKPVANTEQTVKKVAQEATGAKPSKDEIHKKHRLVDDSDEAIQGYIEEFISKTRNLNAGFDPTILVPVFKICAAYTQRGITKFADFASKTIAAFKAKGVKQKDIEPWLAPAWEAVKSFPDTGKKFDAKKLVVALKAVGARYESGLETADAIKDDIRSKYGDKAASTLNDYIDAALRGVQAYFNKGKDAEPAKKSEPSNVADKSGTDLIDYAFNQGGIIRKDVIQNMSPEDVDTVSKIFDGGDKFVDNPQENDTIEEGNSNVVSTKEDKDVRGRKSGSGRPVEVGGPGKSGTSGKGEQRTTRGNSETPDRDGGRERGPDAESAEPKNKGTGGSRKLGRGQTEDGTRMERANGEGTSAGGTKKPVISTKADKVETDIAKGKVKDARDVPGNDYIAKPVPPDAKGASKTQRVDNNIAAIKLLKKIESENRMATPAEQEILAGYSGWGGLGSEMKSDAKRMAQLKELLTEEEYNAAERELLTAFYTPPFVIGRMWELAEHLGFKGGRVLDPSCGVGSFFSLMPASLRERSTALQGVELSPIPARIAKQLYQSKKFKIDNQDYTKFDRGNGFYDLAITNVPFSNSVWAPVPAMRDPDGHVHKSLLIHDYYFAQTLDKVRPGGLIVFMTSSGTMDRKTGYDNALLRYLSSRAKLVGMVRLPNTLFAPSANVGTDIVVFRKLNEGETPDTVDATNGWTDNLRFIEMKDEEGRNIWKTINGYYEDNPDNIIGDPVLVRDRYGSRNVEFHTSSNAETDKKLGEAIARLPENVYVPREPVKINTPSHVKELADAEDGQNVGDIIKGKDGQWGQVVIDDNGEKKLKPFAKSAQAKVGTLKELSDSLNDVLAKQVDPDISEAALSKAREKLNKQYDSFVRKYGYINDKTNVRQISGSPIAGRLLALEQKYKAGTKGKESTAEKAPILTERTAYPATDDLNISTTSDALASSLRKLGFADIKYMASVLGKSENAIIKELGDRLFKDPVSEQYVPRDEYLSGNVRQKLAFAEDAARSEPEYARNVEALKAVIPADIEVEDIEIPLGSPILSVEDTQAFIDDLLGEPNAVVVRYNPVTTYWEVTTTPRYGRISAQAHEKYEIARVSYDDRDNVGINTVISKILNTGKIESSNFKVKDDDSETVRKARAAAEVKAQTIVKDINEKLKEWILKTPEVKQRVGQSYNNKFNAVVPRHYDGSLLTFPWLNAAANMMPRVHQADAVWRTINEKSVLYAHCVGSGKTLTMQAAGLELRRMGLANKIVYCVPKNVVRQFEREFYQVCPSAKILVLDSSTLPDNITSIHYDVKPKMELREDRNGKKKLVAVKDADGVPIFEKVNVSDEEAKKREVRLSKRNAALNQILTHDWDAIIMSHETFQRLPMSDEYMMQFRTEELEKYKRALAEEQAEERQAGKKSKSLKNIQEKIAKLEGKLNALIAKKQAKDFESPSLEDLGIDQLFVDEADTFKNLEVMTKYGQVKGISESAADRSFDMLMKTRHLLHSPNAHGVVFATGTPISNSVVELYTMCRYLNDDSLKRLGVDSFDQFAKMFIDIGQTEVPAQDGSGYEYKTAVRGLRNAPECINLFKEFADVKMVEDLPYIAAARPKAKRVAVAIEESAWNKRFKKDIRARVAAIKSSGRKDPPMINSKSKESKAHFAKTGEYLQVADSPLLVANDLKKASLAPFTVDDSLTGVEGYGKIWACADKIYEEWKDSSDRHGAQLVFCDQSIPDRSSNDPNAYDALKSRLIELGIPESDIAFVQDAKTDKAQAALFEAVNEGRVRVLIGSTQKMGAGTNMQHKLVALHHLDCPWRPRDIEQREGRILRQGNENKEVRIYNYVTKGTYDENLWDTVNTKKNVINQLMIGDKSTRNADTSDVDGDNFEALIELANADPDTKRYRQVMSQLTELESAKTTFEKSQELSKRVLVTAPELIDKFKTAIESVKDDMATLEKTSSAKFSMKIGQAVYENKIEANKAFSKEKEHVAKEFAKIAHKYGVDNAKFKDVKIASARGLDIYVSGNNPSFKAGFASEALTVYAKGKDSYGAATPTAIGVWNAMQTQPAAKLKGYETELKKNESELAEAKESQGDTFKDDEKIKSLREEQEELRKKIEEKAKRQRELDSIEPTPITLYESTSFGSYDLDVDDPDVYDIENNIRDGLALSMRENNTDTGTVSFDKPGSWDKFKKKFIDKTNWVVYSNENTIEITASKKDLNDLYEAIESQEETKYSLSQGGKRISPEEMTKQTLSVFPNAQNIETHDNGVSFDLPNGSHVEVNFTDGTISVDRAKAQKDYGGTLKGNEKASGKIEMVDKDALITLTMDSPDETISHEAMHLAWNLLTDRERNALLRTYGSEEGAAEGMREWKIRRKMKQGTIAGKIMQKISDMAHKLLSLFHENDQHVFQKLESGEMWERSNENNTAARNVKYKMNPLNEAEKYLKSHKDLGEKAGVYIDRTFRPDLAKAKANPNISVNKTAKKKGWGVANTALNNTVRSPSRIKSPKTNYIWGLADTAQRELQELRGRWTHNFAGAIKNLNKEEKARYTDILWEEDMKQYVFSDEELRDAGVSENVIKAHQKTRNLLGKIYNAVNAVYTSERVENFTYKTRKGAEKAQKELAKRPHTFVMHDIRETTKDGEPVFQVSIKTRGYKEIHSVMTSEELSALSKDKDVYIKARKQMDDGSFKVSYLAYNKPLTNMEGYMPHIFHGVLIMKKYTDADGNVKSKVVGSADTIEKAVVKADAMQKEEGGEFIIAPKEFSSEGDVENPLLLGDMDYFKLMESLSKGASLTLDEAREMTHATMKGRHVYYGAKKHRKGAEGFEKNAIWAIQHHIDSSSRYVALDPFKQKAISFFERAFGDYNKDWTGEAAFCKGYIDSVLGKPSRLETLANDFLRLFPWFKNEARPARRMAGNLTGLTGVLKLGASLSSGFVNTLQLFNCVGYVGARKTAVGLKRALHPNAADKKILVASGVSEESGLALDSIGHITAEGTALSKVGNVINSVNNFLMKPFTLAEKTIRKATILAAYYKAIGDGLSKGEAIQYARDINRKVNFDYSVADAPRIFRALQGTVIGDMALQFQKYGVKEMEVISDFLPILGNTTTKQKLEFFIPYLLVSGIWNAFPFEDALLSLLKLLGFDDPEKEAKRAMMEWAGNNADRKALVNVANYGAGAIVGVDISQRVGLKGVVPETSNIVTGGPLGSTTVQLAKAVLNGDTNGAMKAISPAAGNIYGAVAGYNTDSKGRKTVDYDTRDRIVRGLGFRTIKEANATDAQSIVYNYKEQKKNDRAKAKSEYFKDPSSSNRQKLKEMGYSDKEIKALKDDKKSTRVERSQSGLSKEDKKKLKPVFDYVQ